MTTGPSRQPIDWQLTIDSPDPHTLSDFWVEVLGYEHEDHHDQITGLLEAGHVTEDLTVRHHGRLAWIIGAGIRGGGRRILFTRVPEPKTIKNRVHIDLNVGREHVLDEVARIEQLGGTKVREVEEWGQFHVVMQDPEGNEFCLQ
jgi:catechol 2,3-dioxygenase-like lactoylglutathione lyase family enzyme